MVDKVQTPESSGAHYVVYDKTSGQILHRHSRFSLGSNARNEVPVEHIKAMLALDQSSGYAAVKRNTENIGILRLPSDQVNPPKHRMMVDVAREAIVPMPALRLSAKKLEVLGDGKDSADIDIEVLAADGKTTSPFNGQIKLTTSRGKLSARGGVVDVVNGRARVSLTSVPETVSVVSVSATALKGVCADGDLRLEFV
jgi:hypothetical protein